MQTQSVMLMNESFNDLFISKLSFNSGAACRLTLPVGESQSIKLSASLNLVMVLNGNACIDNDHSSYAPSSLLLLKAGYYRLGNSDKARDTVILCLSLDQNWLLNFKQRYQTLITSVLESHNVVAHDKIAFTGCDLTRMAMTGLDTLLDENQIASLTALKIEELLLLQVTKAQGASLLNMLVDGCDPATERFRQFIETNFLQDWSLEQFAKQIGMSLTAFKTTFNQVYQTSPRAWFNEQRLTYAEHLLHTSQMRVIEIAIEAGFSSQSYFTQAFKSRFGITPKQARRS